MGEHGLDVKAHSISKWEKNVNLPNVMQFFALCEILEITDINKTFQIGNKENLFMFPDEYHPKLYHRDIITRKPELHTNSSGLFS